MPVNLPPRLPAVELLRKENIFVMDNLRAMTQDIRPLRVGIVNLMPLKVMTETDLVRLLSNSPLQVELTLIRLDSHIPKTTPFAHLEEFYTPFSRILADPAKNKFDGLIVTGAPVEEMPFEQVKYWEEIKHIFAWAETHVTSTLFICWAAQAALYYKYGVPKYSLPEKLFGVFEVSNNRPSHPLLRGFDDVFLAPHSRHTEVRRADLARLSDVDVLCEGDDVGVHLMCSRSGREVYVTGHAEYSPNTLDGEYRRDVLKGKPISIPKNYYRNDNPEDGVVVRWRGHGNLMYTNWLNYCVYQETPVNLCDIC